jgi:hypothetical protein
MLLEWNAWAAVRKACVAWILNFVWWWEGFWLLRFRRTRLRTKLLLTQGFARTRYYSAELWHACVAKEKKGNTSAAGIESRRLSTFFLPERMDRENVTILT